MMARDVPRTDLASCLSLVMMNPKFCKNVSVKSVSSPRFSS